MLWDRIIKQVSGWRKQQDYGDAEDEDVMVAVLVAVAVVVAIVAVVVAVVVVAIVVGVVVVLALTR